MNLDRFSIHFDFECSGELRQRPDERNDSEEDPVHSFRHAGALASAGHHRRAGDLFLAAADSGGANAAEAYLRAGVCQLLDDRFGEAALSFEKALRVLPDRYDLHVLLGICHHYLGLAAKANVHWWVAGRINPTPFIQNLIVRFLTDEHHPERASLYPICIGKGIDVGCGHRKTHPDSIGVDLVPAGSKGGTGCVTGKISVADVVASGDHLSMFADGELDYVVQRHNLEHYTDFIKTIQEWKRIVKPGGLIGMVVPDDEHCDTIRMDPAHKHAFTQSSLARAIGLIGGLQILHLGELLRNWSFLCILQKSQDPAPGGDRFLDYGALILEFEQAHLLMRARDYERSGDLQSAQQCFIYRDRALQSAARSDTSVHTLSAAGL